MNRVRIVALSALLVAASSPAFAQNAIQSEIPDFYQHQGLGSATPIAGWEGVGTAGAAWNGVANIDDWGGICRATALTDALYPWYASGNYASLYGPNVTVAGLTGKGTWLGQSNVAQQFVNAGVTGNSFSTYLTNQRDGPGGINVQNGAAGLTSTGYEVGADGNLHMVLADGSLSNSLGSIFSYYQTLSDWGQEAGAQQGVTTVLYMTPTAAAKPGKAGYPYWWGNYHAVAGAGYSGGQILYADPDAIPVNAGNGNGAPPPVGGAGFLTSVANNQYGNAANGAGQSAGGTPVPGNSFTNVANANVNYTAANLYGTMTVNATGVITASSGPYATLVKGKPSAQLVAIDAISQVGADLVSEVPVGGGSSDTEATFDVNGEFGGDIDELMIFPGEDIDAADDGFSFNDPGWATSLVTEDPLGDAMPDGGLLLTEDTGSNLEPGDSFLATLNTSLTFTTYTVFAFDETEDKWLGETVSSVDDTVFPEQDRAVAAPDAPTGGLAAVAIVLGALSVAIRRRRADDRRRSASWSSGGVA